MLPSSHLSNLKYKLTTILCQLNLVSTFFLFHLPFKERPCFPDVGVAHASPGGLRDVLLLKELLDGLSHDSHCIIDVGWLILAVDELEANQTWDRAQNKQASAICGSQKFVRILLQYTKWIRTYRASSLDILNEGQTSAARSVLTAPFKEIQLCKCVWFVLLKKPGKSERIVSLML